MLVKAILLYAFFLQISLGKVLQAFVIFRHGARTPITFYYEPNQYKEKPGILTELGKQQVRELGQQLRKRYIDDADLVSSDYNHHEVFLRSSVKLRTNESTYHLLQGLFPEKDIEDIHVNYVSLVRDLYYHAHREDQCPFIIPIIKSMKRTDEYRYMEEYFKNNLYSRIVDRVNEEGKHNYTIDMLSMKQAKKVFDGFKCNRAHGLKNPNYSEEEVALFYKLNLWYSYSYKFGSDIVRKLANSPVFAEIRKFMHCLNETNQHMHHECPRLILFSAHDSNLISILKSFVPLEKLLDDRQYLPPFAADITIEVHQDDFTEETWIEVYYNGKPLALWEEGKEKVSTDEFHIFLQDNILHDIAATCDG